ncbi:CoA ester lyase [Maribius pontilimi]|uniref:CoA ester lyase n=1 Tax=Palleronia pontilimi TaxID=1964209 RepID=A0A934IEM3_9RHOB|nr:CoA ester lyase [Palleronia pontilimi]MBJ3761195.1 CoA ester lyase [Palleronia pontilimi]
MRHRSWLFVPGDSARKMARAAESGADALIYDLEDSVAPGAKDDARAVTFEALRAGANAARWVRVNALGTGRAEEDVVRTIGAAPDGYVLPKCEGRADIDALAGIIAGAGGRQPILVIATETVRAVRSLAVSDWAHPALFGMAWGAEDLAADLGAMANRGADGAYLRPFLGARDTMLFAAKAAGAWSIDGVFTDFSDPDGLRAEADAAAEMGFDGKLAIHPAQVAAINAAFSPSDAQLAWAQRVIAAMAEAGDGVAQLDGKMLDQPHLKTARAILARAE